MRAALLPFVALLALPVTPANAQDAVPPERRAPDIAARFAAMDANGDGRIDRTEFAAAPRMRGPRPGAGGPDARPGDRPRRPQAGGGMAPERMFDRMDANRDGFVDRQEFKAAAEAFAARRQARRAALAEGNGE